MKKANEIFIPGALPDSTYVTRVMKSGFTYEERLKQALSISGYLMLISGPSKIGKTVLCEKVIGMDHLVEISGSDIVDPRGLWTQIGMKAGMPREGTAKPGNRKLDYMEKTCFLTKESVLNYFKDHDLVLLMDDFHYAPEEMQTFMAQQFKDAIRKGLRIIIASLPHRATDTIRTNPDLQGRVSIIDMPAWSKTDLEQIPRKGFEELEMAVPTEIIDALTKESIFSPQLMQLICLNICILAESRNLKEINDPLIKDAFLFSTLNLDYDKVVRMIQKGKSPRGQKRPVYHTEHLGNLHLYGLILEALALDPPFASISFEDLCERILRLVQDDSKPAVNSIKGYLKNLQEVLNSCGHSYEVLEWKDNTLYILESLFLFYLRWGRCDKHDV